MTYGEYWIAMKNSMEMVEGKWTIRKPSHNVPKQMSRDEAGHYYNNKLKSCWNLSTY